MIIGVILVLVTSAKALAEISTVPSITHEKPVILGQGLSEKNPSSTIMSEPNFTASYSARRQDTVSSDDQVEEEIDSLSFPRVDYSLYPYYDDNMDDMASRVVKYDNWSQDDWDREEEKWKNYPVAAGAENPVLTNPETNEPRIDTIQMIVVNHTVHIATETENPSPDWTDYENHPLVVKDEDGGFLYGFDGLEESYKVHEDIGSLRDKAVDSVNCQGALYCGSNSYISLCITSADHPRGYEAKACTQCPGTRWTEPGSSSVNQCRSCKAGMYNSKDRTKCYLCPAGRYRSNGDLTTQGHFGVFVLPRWHLQP